MPDRPVPLTAENVERLFTLCELLAGAPGGIEVSGLVHRFRFDREQIQRHRVAIAILLDQLPEEFHASGGGGWSFLNGALDRHGEQWGDQPDVQRLLCLGMAAGMVRQLAIPEAVLPGGVPYYVVDTRPKPEKLGER